MAIDYGSIIDGALASNDISTDGLPIDMEPMTHLFNPNAYPFEALMRAVGGKVETNQMEHKYRVRRLVPNYVTLAAAAAAGATALTVAGTDYTRVKNDFYLYVPSTGELLLVQDASIDTTISVVQADGTSGIATAIANGATVIILGESHAEGEAVPTAYTNDSVTASNYVMQKDRRIQVTDIEEAIEHYDNTEKLDADRRLAMIEYRRDMDLLFYVGQGTREVATGDGRRHCCSGLIELITENVHDLSASGGVLTLNTLGAIMGETTLLNNSQKKTALCGVNAWMQISAWPQEKLREASGKDKRWGVSVSSLITGFGDMDVVYDPVLSANYALQDRIFILDLADIKQLFLRKIGGPKFYLDINEAKTLHQRADAISGTFGMQLKFPELHAHVKGVA